MEDDVLIISVETGEAVRNVGELRTNINAYKEALEVLDIGSKEYAETLQALQINQAALKSAMHATTDEGDQQGKTMEQLAKDAMGLGTSYNSLVRQMAILDQQFRNEEEAAKRDAIGAQIKNINAQLKELDEQRGKFGRNVGNYKSALDGIASGFRATAGGAASVIPKVQGVTTGLKALSATPVIGILGLLAGALDKVIKGLGTSEENTNRWNKALAVFKPLGDAATRTIQGIGDAVAKTAEWITDLLDKWGLMNDEMRNRQYMEEYAQNTTEIARTILKANAQLESDVAVAREKAADKEKYTAQDRIKFLEQAQWAERQIAKNNQTLAERRLEQLRQEAALSENSKEVNDELARAEVAVIQVRTENALKMRRLNKELAAARREAAAQNKEVNAAEVADMEETAGAIEDTVEAALLAELEYINSIKVSGADLVAVLSEIETHRAEQLALQTQQVEEGAASLESMWAEQTATIQQELDAQLTAEWDAAQEEKRIMEERKDVMLSFGSGVADLLGSLASIYEANGKEDEKAAQKAKALRIAESVINAITGAIAAYTGTLKSVPGPAGMALGAINAATALAAGMANVRKIQATKVGNGDSGGSVNVPAIATAPAVGMSPVQQVRTITGQSEEERLNRMADTQRVVLVWSDVEAAQRTRRVQLAETSF